MNRNQLLNSSGILVAFISMAFVCKLFSWACYLILGSLFYFIGHCLFPFINI
jgi:F0F1-type ATP synthase assembly protein I